MKYLETVYYKAYSENTPEENRSYFDYLKWIRSKFMVWAKESGHRGGFEGEAKEAFKKWLGIVDLKEETNG
jgi:hypothetical protein